MLTVTIARAAGLFKELGFDGTQNWKINRLEGRLRNIKEAVEIDDDQILGPDAKDTLFLVLKALEAGEAIEVEDTAPLEKQEPNPEGLKPETPSEEPQDSGRGLSELAALADDQNDSIAMSELVVRAEALGIDHELYEYWADVVDAIEAYDEDDGEQPVGNLKRMEESQRRPAKRRKNKKLRQWKVQSSPTRSFLAGVVLKRHGVETGVSEDMIQELNEMYGNQNDKQSENRLRLAWHVINGYLDEEGE